MPFFTQINLHKAEQAAALLGRGLEGKTDNIVLITEPRTTNRLVTGLPRGTRLLYHRPTKASDQAPRAAILATRDVSAISLDSLSNRDCAAALVKIQKKWTLIASIYLDIKKTVTPPGSCAYWTPQRPSNGSSSSAWTPMRTVAFMV